MTIYAKIITLAAILVALAVGAQAQTPEIDALRARGVPGDVEAQVTLGLMYFFGDGVPQDYAEAVRWLRQAADQEHANAQYNLGVMYAEGRGVPQDEAEAVRWYRLAAAQGLAGAQFNLGFMYFEGTRCAAGRRRSGLLVPSGGCAGVRQGAVQPRVDVRQRTRRPAGLRASPHVDQPRGITNDRR